MRMRPFVWIIVATYTVTATAPTGMYEDCYNIELSGTFKGRYDEFIIAFGALSKLLCLMISFVFSKDS